MEVRRREKLEALDRLTGISGLVTVDPSSGTISEFPKKLQPLSEALRRPLGFLVTSCSLLPSEDLRL